MLTRAYCCLLSLSLLWLIPPQLASANSGKSRADLPSLSFTANGEQRDDAKRADAELTEGEADFDRARSAYDSGNIDRGDAALEDMTKALDACVVSLGAAHKARFYKKAEMRVANLQRRLASLLEDISLPERGWAEQTNRKLEEIHDKLLAGVMSK